MIDAGKLRTKITYQEKTAGTPSEYGDAAEVWTDVCDMFADVQVMSGNKLFQAKQIHAEATAQITIHYNANILPSGRFAIGTRYLYPISVSADPLNRFQTCLCRERVEVAT